MFKRGVWNQPALAPRASDSDIYKFKYFVGNLESLVSERCLTKSDFQGIYWWNDLRGKSEENH